MRAHGGEASLIVRAWQIIALLAFLTFGLAALVAVPQSNGLPSVAVRIAGLFLFGTLFALSSSLHSWMIVAVARTNCVTIDVGFYSMANAAGRLFGTPRSGVAYQAGGLSLTLFLAGGMLPLAAVLTRRLRA